MNLSVEQKLAINMKVARDMGLEVDDSILPYDGYIPPVIYKNETFARPFDIFDPEKGDLDKAVEFYKLNTEWKWGAKWWECKRSVISSPRVYARHESMPVAQQKAVIAASGVTV